MKNIEKYYNELNSSFLNPNCHWKKKIRNEECTGISCKECGSDFLQWLNQEYKEPIKLTQFEYDIINYHGKLSKFNDICILMAMKNKGHFKDMNSVEKCSMTIKEILENCEVVENVD